MKMFLFFYPSKRIFFYLVRTYGRAQDDYLEVGSTVHR